MNYAVILSGGVGTRIGLDIPKQYYKVNGRFILSYVLDVMEQNELLNGYVIVAAPQWQPEIAAVVEENNKFLGFAEPGENRQMSVYHGLLALKKTVEPKDEDIVLIQDGVRPNTTDELLNRCFSLAVSEDGAMPVLPMKDTVYLSKDGERVTSLLNRQEIFAGQAPEAFRFGKYMQANEALFPDEILQINGSTEPAIRAGMQIVMIDGDEHNYKITTRADLEQFCRERDNETKYS